LAGARLAGARLAVQDWRYPGTLLVSGLVGKGVRLAGT